MIKRILMFVISKLTLYAERYAYDFKRSRIANNSSHDAICHSIDFNSFL